MQLKNNLSDKSATVNILLDFHLHAWGWVISEALLVKPTLLNHQTCIKLTAKNTQRVMTNKLTVSRKRKESSSTSFS